MSMLTRPIPFRSTRLRAFAILPLFALLGGCGMVVMDPAGDVAVQQRDLVVIATILMLLIIIPVVALIILFAWRYRQSNADARYEPDWDHSTQLELVIWALPLLIIICLGAITWVGTHLLDPYRPIGRMAEGRPVDSHVRPLEVQVVALDWKWLFIYPEQGIATVNELAAPVDRPIAFKITASSLMNSFYIPALAGQIYAMPGMETKLHAVINTPGDYAGFSANYSGDGFSGMRFRFHGMSQADFGAWLAHARKGGGTLDRGVYLRLARPSEKEPVRRFAAIDPKLYNAILNQCVAPGTPCMSNTMWIDATKDGRTGHGGHGGAPSAAPSHPGGNSGHGAPTPHDVTPTQGPHAAMAMPDMPGMKPAPAATRARPATAGAQPGSAGLTGAGLAPPPSPFQRPRAVAIDTPVPAHNPSL